jgi:hypothetical protein
MKLYHCSKTQGIKYLTPKDHPLTNNPVVFATPSQMFALSMAYGTDRQFDVGYYSTNNSEMRFYIKEKRRGNFSMLKKPASLYEVEPSNFEKHPNLMHGEVISYAPVQVLKEIKVPNVLTALYQANAELVMDLKTAVIITGNPKYIQGNRLATQFYNELKEMLIHEMGIKQVVFNPGHAHTVPLRADLWVGHSRGMDRLQYAPKGTFTVGIGGKGGIYHPKDNQINFDPKNPTKPNKYHFALTSLMKFQIKHHLIEGII